MFRLDPDALVLDDPEAALAIVLARCLAMMTSQIASGLVDFSSTDGARKSPKQTTSVISSLLSAADGLTSMTDDSEEKIATQGLNYWRRS